MKTDNTELFEQMPVSKAVITLIIPTVISQIITVIYNMADTFFIGQMNDPNQVAAATLAMPPFVMLTGIANLFGIGGSSLISRSLGIGDKKKKKKCASFSIWSAAGVSFIYGVVMYLIRPVVQSIMGHANIETTMDIYAEVTDAKKQEAIENLAHKLDVF